MSHDIPGARSAQTSQFDVVAVGASAGGVEALHVIVSALPATFPAAVLIVQHMDPRHKSLLAGLLGRRCLLTVKQAWGGGGLRGGTVFKAQPHTPHNVSEDHHPLTDDQLAPGAERARAEAEETREDGAHSEDGGR